VREFQNTGVMTMHIFNNPSVWFALAGIVVAWIAYIGLPSLPGLMATRLRWLYLILIRKYGFDDFNQIVLVHGTQKVANTLYKVTDEKIIDEAMVNGSGRAISWLSSTVRKLQTGYLYHYGLTMMLGLVIFIWWLLI
jgi:NADH-quinone oxidoreductase subunit L